MKRARRTAAVCTLVLLSTCPAGMSAAAAQDAVFRSRVALGTIDVIVVDRDGNPLADLLPDELIVRVDGRRRDVRSIAPLGIAAPAMANGVRETRGAASNRDGGEVEFERRLIIILFDDLSFAAFEGRALAESASRFIDARPREDLVGVFSSSGLGTQVFPSTDRAPAVRALRQFVGQRRVDVRDQDDVFVALTEAVAIAGGDLRVFETVFERECPMSGMPDALCEQIIRDRAMMFAVDLRERTNRQIARVQALIRAIQNQARGAQLVLLTRGIAETGGDVPVRALAREAAAQNVSMFALHQAASGVAMQARRPETASSADRALERDGVQNIVGAMGGTILPVAGTSDRHFRSLGRQLDAIQRVGFALEPEDERRGERRVRITTTRRGARVVPAERLMSFAVAAVESEGEGPLTPEGRLENLLTSSAVSNAIPITARAFVAREPQGRGLRLTLAASAEATEPLRAAFALHAATGVKIAGGTSPGMIESASGAVPLNFTTVVPPGDYVLRLAVLSEAGAVGTLAYAFRARLTVAGALVLSDPLLWAGDGRRPVHSVSDRIATATGLHARIEAYPSGSASVEGHALVVSVVPPGGGPALVTTRVSLTVDADGAAATAWLPVDALSSGDYTLRTTIERDGAAVQTLERPFSLEKLTIAPAAPATPETAASEPALESPAPFVPASWLDEGGLAAVTDAFGRAGVTLSAATLTALSSAAATAGPAQTVEALLIRTVAALRSDQLDLAASSLNALTRQLRSSPAVLPLTGAVYAARGHDREAAAAWATAEAAGADDPAIRIAAIDALRRLGAHTEADSLLDDALARWPAHPRVRARVKKR